MPFKLQSKNVAAPAVVVRPSKETMKSGGAMSVADAIKLAYSAPIINVKHSVI